jgi:glycosyltransferase involved in cell wall biosynthesis
VQLYYYAWQIGAYIMARRLHRKVGFDAVHHVTLAKHWAPSFLVLLGVPFVWGPVGGGDSIPKTFWRDFGLLGIVYEAGRDLARWVAERDPFVKLTARRSVVALAATPGTAKRLRALGARNVRVVSQLGMSDEELAALARLPRPAGGPTRFISVGELFWWKGIRLALRAFAQARLNDCEYWIVGSGRERRRLQRLAQSLGIDKRVRFWGELPRDETLRRLAESHILVFAGLRDSGGMACLEAMAMGRSIICLDLAGPSSLTRGVALQMPAHRPEQVVRDLAAGMVRLACGPELREEMEEAGRQRSKEAYRWERKAEFFDAVYRNAVSGLAGLPDGVLKRDPV